MRGFFLTLTRLISATAVGAGLLVSAPARAQETIKVGVLHSLSGTMAISETTLKDTMLFLIDEQNKRAASSARSSRPSLSTRRPTGRCSPKRLAS